MYRHFFQQMTEAFGAAGSKLLLLILPALMLLALLVLGSAVWRRRLAAMEDAPGRWPLFWNLVVNFLRVAFAVGGIAFLCVMLRVEAGLFAERHGRVTQRNYDAVTSKWGLPHEQGELRVRHAVWQTATVEEFAGGGSRTLKGAESEPALAGAEDEEVLSDETFDAKRGEDGKPADPHEVVRRVKKRLRVVEPAEAIASGEINVEIRNCPRFLGGAGYAGFEDACNFQYTVTNPLPRAAGAHFEFPLPAEGRGLFDRLSIRVDGQEVRGLRYAEGSLRWSRAMASGEQLKVEVSYQSRGLEHFRYLPGQMREKYLVALRLRGVPRERLNFPIGAMSPKDDLAALSGEDYTLHWDLSRAVTNFSIGVIVPPPKQPGFEVARLLREAPPGLAMLALLLAVTRLLLGAKVELLPLALSLLASYLGYTAFAGVSDLVDSFPAAFALGVTVPALAGAIFWLRRDGRGLLGLQSAALHMLFTVGYPLAVYFDSTTEAVLKTGYVVLAAYVMFLAAKAWRSRPEVTAPG
jgi:hypothetical protein